ncbi:unnamed protein product [Schistosoma turkestanicum]|nr:unnamed protein product [Schistosoma turkestanicum]
MFTFDHPQFPQELISFIPVHRVSSVEQDVHTNSCFNKEDFFRRYCKQWFGIPVLLNQLNPDKMQSFNDVKSKMVMRNLIVRELEVISRIHHPNIMSLLSIIHDDIPRQSWDSSINLEKLALVYERPPMGTMYEYIQSNPNALSTLSALIVACQLSEALLFLHSSGIIHCGVTPHAVYMYALDRVKLGNFEYSQYIHVIENQENDNQPYTTAHNNNTSMHKSKSHSHHHHRSDYPFHKTNPPPPTPLLPHHHYRDPQPNQLPSIYNLLFGIYYLPANYLSDWLPLELYDSTKQLFHYINTTTTTTTTDTTDNTTDNSSSLNFSDILQCIPLNEIIQTIQPTLTSDVYSLAKLIQFILPKLKQIPNNFNEYLLNTPNNLSALIDSALKSNSDERLSMRQLNRLLIHFYWVS